MHLVRANINNPQRLDGCVATMGHFDGLHLGHQALIAQTVAQAKQNNMPAVLLSFNPFAYEYFHPDTAIRLQRWRDKLNALQQLGIDVVYLLRFDENLSAMCAEDFVIKFLQQNLKVQTLLVGDDCRFGAGRHGDVNLLRQHLPEVMLAETIMIDGKRVSSSRVREACLAGDVAQVTKLLGQPLQISGHVVYGDQRGREIGFPTANIVLPQRMRQLSGVFAVEVMCNGQLQRGVANIGCRPTVCGQEWRLEVHLFDFNQDIYGKLLTIAVVAKIRSEKKFANFSELQQQIADDVVSAAEFFAGA